MANVIWTPQPRQAALMARFEDEALYGGAAGGGKSDCALAEALRQVEIPHYRGLILRKTFPQLTELMDRSTEIYRRAYKKARFNESKHVWTFPSGAKIFFGSMQYTKDRTNYQGKRYDFIDFDELTQFLWEEYSYLFSRNRPNGPGTRCYIRAQANPGGVGHGWVFQSSRSLRTATAKTHKRSSASLYKAENILSAPKSFLREGRKNQRLPSPSPCVFRCEPARERPGAWPSH